MKINIKNNIKKQYKNEHKNYKAGIENNGNSMNKFHKHYVSDKLLHLRRDGLPEVYFGKEWKSEIDHNFKELYRLILKSFILFKDKKILLIDCGNSFDPYRLAGLVKETALRRSSQGGRSEYRVVAGDILNGVLVSRMFTAHQLKSKLSGLFPEQDVSVISSGIITEGIGVGTGFGVFTDIGVGAGGCGSAEGRNSADVDAGNCGSAEGGNSIDVGVGGYGSNKGRDSTEDGGSADIGGLAEVETCTGNVRHIKDIVLIIHNIDRLIYDYYATAENSPYAVNDGVIENILRLIGQLRLPAIVTAKDRYFFNTYIPKEILTDSNS